MDIIDVGEWISSQVPSSFDFHKTKSSVNCPQWHTVTAILNGCITMQCTRVGDGAGFHMDNHSRQPGDCKRYAQNRYGGVRDVRHRRKLRYTFHIGLWPSVPLTLHPLGYSVPPRSGCNLPRLFYGRPRSPIYCLDVASLHGLLQRPISVVADCMARVPGRCRNADILGRSLSHFSYMRIRCGGDSLHRAIHRLDAWMDVTVQFAEFILIYAVFTAWAFRQTVMG
jgi:hypothetical protein